MNEYIELHKEEFDHAIEHLKKEMSSLRTGRAKASIVEDVMVEAYGVKSPIKQMASISIPEAKTILIEPWDKNVIKEIEKAINEANIGIAPIADSKVIRLNIPPLTEENRKELVKILGQKVEQARISIRKVRDEAKEEILEAEKNKEMGEDERFAALEELDETTKEYNEKIKEMAEEKEKEIMTI